MADLARKDIAKKASSSHDDLFLRKLVRGDKKKVCRWMSNPYIIQNSFVVPSPSLIPADFASEKYAERYFEHLITDKQRDTFAILYHSHHVGNIGLKDIDLIQGVADCFIEIGESDKRGQGLGYAAMECLLDFAFFERNLLEISLDVLEFNTAAIKLYKKLGFISDGETIWHYDEYGQYWRVLRMSLSAQGWRFR